MPGTNNRCLAPGVPRNEFPRFPAVLSFAMLLGPGDLLAGLDRELGEHAHLPRVTLIESEYQRAVLAAEPAWVDAVAADLRSGALTWSQEELAAPAAADPG